MRASDVQREIDRITQNRTSIMNERLTQLAKQAQVEHCISHVRLQEFAELIIYECMEINQQELAFNALTRVRERYEKHFGVDIET